MAGHCIQSGLKSHTGSKNSPNTRNHLGFLCPSLMLQISGGMFKEPLKSVFRSTNAVISTANFFRSLLGIARYVAFFGWVSALYPLTDYAGAKKPVTPFCSPITTSLASSCGRFRQMAIMYFFWSGLLLLSTRRPSTLVPKLSPRNPKITGTTFQAQGRPRTIVPEILGS